MSSETKKLGTQRYAPTHVERVTFDPETYGWVAVVDYPDAQIVSISDDGVTRAPQVMLRAYSNDPDTYNTQEEIEGNGIHVADDGWVYDCDSDIAVERIVMIPIARREYGQVTEHTGFVGYSKTGAWGSGTREVEEWDGFGHDAFRLERWYARFDLDAAILIRDQQKGEDDDG